MKKMRLLALCMAVMLLLTACGGASENDLNKGDASIQEAPGLAGSDTSTNIQTNLPQAQKLVRKVWLDAETEEMDPLLADVESRIAALGGYVEAREIQNGSAYSGRRYRYADLTIRIPAEKLYSFVDEVRAVSNITSTKESTDDVTLSYVENESRVTALETEQARLLELLAKAETMEDILKIESRLTDIREQLETVKSQLRLYDNLVTYGTVYLHITEVQTYTIVEEPETLLDRMSQGISESWQAMVKGVENFLVLLVVILPHLLPLSIIAAAVLIPIWLYKKKKAKKNQPSQEQKTE